jgi:adenylate kinase family enzyme
MGCSNCRKVSQKRVIFVIGGPGSGKGTQCCKISNEFNFEHLSTRDILLNVIAKQTVIGWEQLKQKIDSGVSLSSHELISFIKEEFKNINKTILFEGFPKNTENIEEWNKQMINMCEVTAVLYFECSTDEMKKRLMKKQEAKIDNIEETISKRIEIFNKETLPILEMYQKTGKLIKINAEKSTEEIFEEVKTIIKEKKLN